MILNLIIQKLKKCSYNRVSAINAAFQIRLSLPAMNIGFDAKRAFHNSTGLGVYSRVLLTLLAQHFPEHEYFLFNPRPGNLYQPTGPHVHEIQPQKTIHKILKGAWRSRWVISDVQKLGIDLYHGLSHEIPVGIGKTGTASVVTIHDMFPEIYPGNFKPIDLKIYRAKTRYACTHSTRILAISHETKKHIVSIYNIDPEKIDVIHQSYDPAFDSMATAEQKALVRKKYNLPAEYFLHVGTIIERKNLLNICKAINLIKNEINMPLVVIGNGKEYKEKVKAYLTEKKLGQRVIFLSDALAAAGNSPFITAEDMPAIYQMSKAMIYPSFYEGFGIPVAEGLASGVPVITSNTSCLPEAGGDAALYVSPGSPEEMAEAFRKIYSDAQLVASMREKGFEHVKKFEQEAYVKAVMNMYHKTLNLA